jgi:hypothetical protein
LPSNSATSFHLIASPFTSNISGFAAPIGGYLVDPPAEDSTPTAEPIWVALSHAGKKVVTATWPGADGLDIRLSPGSPTSPTLQKTSPLETVIVGGVTYSILVAALDTTDDHAPNYETLVFFDATSGIQPGPLTLPSTGSAFERAVTSEPAANIYIKLAGREPDGTVSQSEYLALSEQVVEILKNFFDTNLLYTLGAPQWPVFDKVYTRPADLSDLDFGRSTNAFIGQDSGDVFRCALARLQL